MSTNHRESYRALVAALRAEFGPTAREVLWIELRQYRYDLSSLGALAHAVHDARDDAYETGAPPCR
jgi:hypothetical protein